MGAPLLRAGRAATCFGLNEDLGSERFEIALANPTMFLALVVALFAVWRPPLCKDCPGWRWLRFDLSPAHP